MGLILEQAGDFYLRRVAKRAGNRPISEVSGSLRVTV